VILAEAPVIVDRAERPIERIQIAIQQLTHGRVRAWMAPLVDLIHQPYPDFLRDGFLVRRVRRDVLDQTVPLACHRVDPRVHPHAQGAAGPDIDYSLLRRAAPRFLLPHVTTLRSWVPGWVPSELSRR
jgi:hypothetical protein